MNKELPISIGPFVGKLLIVFKYCTGKEYYSSSSCSVLTCSILDEHNTGLQHTCKKHESLTSSRDLLCSTCTVHTPFLFCPCCLGIVSAPCIIKVNEYIMICFSFFANCNVNFTVFFVSSIVPLLGAKLNWTELLQSTYMYWPYMYGV